MVSVIFETLERAMPYPAAKPLSGYKCRSTFRCCAGSVTLNKNLSTLTHRITVKKTLARLHFAQGFPRVFQNITISPHTDVSKTKYTLLDCSDEFYIDPISARGKHHPFKRGYKNVIDEGIRLNSVGEETHLAIETSGNGALKENNWLDDGAYAMVKLLIKMAAAATAGEGKGSGVLTKLIEELQEAVEVRFKIDQAHPDVDGCGTRSLNPAHIRMAAHTILCQIRVSVKVVFESLSHLCSSLYCTCVRDFGDDASSLTF
jgi:hypothetical protein